MKVFREGFWPEPKTWSKRLTCSHCRAVLEICTSDIKFTPASGVDFCDESYSVRCGFCHNHLAIGSIDLPRSVRKKLGLRRF